MPKRNSNKNTVASRNIETVEENQNLSWIARHFAVIMGGGTFALLAVITLVMYFVNN